MKKLLIGRSPLTTIAGYVLAVLLTVHQMGIAGTHKWQDFILPAAIALFGRMAADDSNKRPPLPPLPMPLPEEPAIPPVISTAFQRCGRETARSGAITGALLPQLSKP